MAIWSSSQGTWALHSELTCGRHRKEKILAMNSRFPCMPFLHNTTGTSLNSVCLLCWRRVLGEMVIPCLISVVIPCLISVLIRRLISVVIPCLISVLIPCLISVVIPFLISVPNFCGYPLPIFCGYPMPIFCAYPMPIFFLSSRFV